jgi:negative regulator of flagellin synthesis FlgM
MDQGRAFRPRPHGYATFFREVLLVMTDISSASLSAAGRVEQHRISPTRRLAPSGDLLTPRPSDEVELSAHARFLAKMREMPSIREDLVARVRDEIASGQYDTAERLQRALEKIDDLDLQD